MLQHVERMGQKRERQNKVKVPCDPGKQGFQVGSPLMICEPTRCSQGGRSSTPFIPVAAQDMTACRGLHVVTGAGAWEFSLPSCSNALAHLLLFSPRGSTFSRKRQVPRKQAASGAGLGRAGRGPSLKWPHQHLWRTQGRLGHASFCLVECSHLCFSSLSLQLPFTFQSPQTQFVVWSWPQPLTPPEPTSF